MEQNNLENLLEEKLGPIQKKITELESSLNQKQNEILILSYAYQSLLSEISKLKIEKDAPKNTANKNTSKDKNPSTERKSSGTKEPTERRSSGTKDTQKATKSLLIPPPKNLVNTCLQQVKASKFFAFVDIATQIKIRRVCRVWNNEISLLLSDFYTSSIFADKEKKSAILKEVDEKEQEFSRPVRIEPEKLKELKAFKKSPKVINQVCICLLLILGEKLTPADMKADNVFAKMVPNTNIFIGKLMGFMSRKGLPHSSSQKIKQIVEETIELTVEFLGKISAEASFFLEMVQARMKWEEYLDSKLGKQRILINIGASKFFEEVLHKKGAVEEEKKE